MFGQFLHVSLRSYSLLPETARSLLWFAAIQRIECKQDLASLAPKGCFIAAQAIEREIGQISETQKAPRKLNGTDRRQVRQDSARRSARPLLRL